MSFTNLNLNKFSILEFISLNINSIQLTLLIVGLIEFILLHIFLDKKKISTFFLGFYSLLLTPTETSISTSNKTSHASTKQDEKKIFHDHHQSVSKGDVEMVLRSLGMFNNGEIDEKISTKLESDEIFNIFEEKNPSLDEVKEAFDVFDENRDGFIDANELHKVLCALGLSEGLEMEKCRRMIGVFDEDGDGRIDFDEFVKFMENSFI